MTNHIPTRETLIEAHDRIRPYVHNTPVLTSKWLDGQTGAHLHFKCENFQKVGAFKSRGGCNAVFQLSDEELSNGVTTHSSGNHAQALAMAASIRGINAYIVMPENAPQVKVDAVKDYGAQVVFCAPGDASRVAGVEKVVEETGAVVIHPFNDYRIIAGQASAAKELLETCPDLDCIITPVGGGGLLSGTILSARYFAKDVDVIAAEPKGADDLYQSIKAGEIIPNQEVDTIADGLRTTVGPLPFEIIKSGVRNVLTVTDDQIVHAMKCLWERMKIVIEPSGAVPLAAVLANAEVFIDKRVGVILTGGNVDVKNLPF